jgi:hypothetical protein
MARLHAPVEREGEVREVSLERIDPFRAERRHGSVLVQVKEVKGTAKARSV